MVARAGEVLELVARVVVTGTLFTMLGAIVGFLSRSQAAGAIAIFGTFIGEKVIGPLLGHAADYLPFGLVSTLLDADSDGAIWAGLVLAVMTAGLGVLAAVLVSRRDLQ